MFSPRFLVQASLLVLVLLVVGFTVFVGADKRGGDKKVESKNPYAWQTLFDGKTLRRWKTPEFFSGGKVSVVDGCIVLGKGDGVTGITFDGEPPRTNYEIEFEAKRIQGDDFFGTVTVPVDLDHCSVVIGGWGGRLVGISLVDYFDASENLTTTDYDLKNDTWYTIRVRTSDTRIEAWIDENLVIDQLRIDRKFGVRFEVDDCCPLGIASWCTEAAIRNIRLRTLRPEEVKAAEKLREGEEYDERGQKAEN